MKNQRVRTFTIDVKAGLTTRDHGVVPENEDIFTHKVSYNSAHFKLMKLAVLNYRVAIFIVNASSLSIRQSSTSERAPLDERRGIWSLVNARHFAL